MTRRRLLRPERRRRRRRRRRRPLSASSSSSSSPVDRPAVPGVIRGHAPSGGGGVGGEGADFGGEEVCEEGLGEGLISLERQPCLRIQGTMDRLAGTLNGNGGSLFPRTSQTSLACF